MKTEMRDENCKMTVQKLRIENSKAWKEIINLIREINYGEVVIVIHNSKVVQIEKREKKRF